MTPFESLFVSIFTMPLQYLAFTLGLGLYLAYAILLVIYSVLFPILAILVWVWANEPEESD